MSPRFLLPYSKHMHAEKAADAPAIDARDISVAYPGSGALALEHVSLRVGSGTRVALVGPNGSGKSTLLKAIAGLAPIRAGTIEIYGHPRGGCHHRVAYLPQRGDVDWSFPISVRRLVLTGRYVHLGWLRRPGAKDQAIADEKIAWLGLSDLAGRQIGQLSGGQQQRVLLARALAQESDLLLLDEPLNAVDAETRAVIAEVLAELLRRGTTVVMATHDLGRLEADFDDVLYLSEGKEIPPPPGGAHHHFSGEMAWAG